MRGIILGLLLIVPIWIGGTIGYFYLGSRSAPTAIAVTDTPLAVADSVNANGQYAIVMDRQGHVTLSDEDIARIARAVVAELEKPEHFPMVLPAPREKR